MSNTDGSGGRGTGWSPELLTVLGAVLAVGVALGTLIFTGLDQVRKDMSAMAGIPANAVHRRVWRSGTVTAGGHATERQAPPSPASRDVSQRLPVP